MTGVTSVTEQRAARERQLVAALAEGPRNEIELARAICGNPCSGQARTMMRQMLGRIAVVDHKLTRNLWVWRQR